MQPSETDATQLSPNKLHLIVSYDFLLIFRQFRRQLNRRSQEAKEWPLVTSQLFFSAAKTKPDELEEMKQNTKNEVKNALSGGDVVLYVPPSIAADFLDSASSVSIFYVPYDRLFQAAIVNDVKLEEYNNIILPGYRKHMSDLMQQLLDDDKLASIAAVIDVDRIKRDNMAHAFCEYLYALIGVPTLQMIQEAAGDPLYSLSQTMQGYFLLPEDLIGYFDGFIRQKTHMDVNKAIGLNKRSMADSVQSTLSKLSHAVLRSQDLGPALLAANQLSEAYDDFRNMDKTTKTLVVRNLGDLNGSDNQTPAQRLVAANSKFLSTLERMLPNGGDFCSSKISEVSMERSLPRLLGIMNEFNFEELAKKDRIEVGTPSEDAFMIARACLTATSVSQLRTLARFVKFFFVSGLANPSILLPILASDLFSRGDDGRNNVGHFLTLLHEFQVDVQDLISFLRDEVTDDKISTSCILFYFGHAAPEASDEPVLKLLTRHLCSGTPIDGSVSTSPKNLVKAMLLALSTLGSSVVPRFRSALVVLGADALVSEALQHLIPIIEEIKKPQDAFVHSSIAALVTSFGPALIPSFLDALLRRISSYNELKPELLGVIDASATLLKAAAEEDKQAFGSRLFAAIPWKQISDPYTRLTWLEIIESDKQGYFDTILDLKEWIQTTKSVAHVLDVSPEVEAVLVGVQSIDSILSSLCHHIFFCHNLFGLKRPYFTMVKQMLQCKYPLIALLGLQHVKGAIASDAQHYGTAMLDVPDFGSAVLNCVFSFASVGSNALMQPELAPYSEAVKRTVGSSKYLSGLSAAVSLFALPFHAVQISSSAAQQLVFHAITNCHAKIWQNAAVLFAIIGGVLKCGSAAARSVILKGRSPVDQMNNLTNLLSIAPSVIRGVTSLDRVKNIVVRAVHECYTILLKESTMASPETDQPTSDDNQDMPIFASSSSSVLSDIPSSDENFAASLDTISFKEYVASRNVSHESQRIGTRRKEMSQELLVRKLQLELEEALSKLNASNSRVQTLTTETESLLEELHEARASIREKDHLLLKQGERIAQLEASAKHIVAPMEATDSPKQSGADALSSQLDDSLPPHWKDLEEPSSVTKEEAAEYVSRLNAVRRNFTGSMRTSMSGALRELGADLYANSTHFLHEMIQNADDCTFSDPSSASMQIIVTSNAILLASNERGFLPREVLSICNLAASSKSGRDSTGQKGVGFKSLYSCTDSPYIVSGNWSFRFEWARGSNDNMGAITPIWSEKEHLPRDFQELVKQCPGFKTFFYVPIRSELLLPSPQSSEFLQDVFKSIDEFILLNTRRIRHLTVTDARSAEKIVNNPLSLNRQLNSPSIPQLTFEGVEFFNIAIFPVQLSASSSGVRKFVTVEAQVKIPLEFLTEAEKSTKKEYFSRITLSFPEMRPDDETPVAEIPSFSVYCTLPIADWGFHFVINAAWHLVTSRDNVSDKPWNFFLCGAVSRLFVWATVLSQDATKYGLTENLGIYLPDDRDIARMSKERIWRKLATDLQTLIRTHLPDVLLGSSAANSRGVRLLNKDLHAKGLVVDWDALEALTGFRILGREEHTLKVLLQCRQQLLEASDLLDCLSSLNISTSSQSFAAWAHSQPREWWQIFFSCLQDEINRSSIDHAQKMALIARSAAIFHLDSSNPKRTTLPGSVGAFSVRCCDVECERMAPASSWWRKDEFSVCFPDSQAEFQFLTNKTASIAAELDVAALAERISSLHLMNPRTPGTKDEVMHDLVFLFTHQDEINWPDMTICLPTSSGAFLLSTECVLSTLLGLSLPFNKQAPSTAVSERPSSVSPVEWESFLINRLGVKFPAASMLDLDCSTPHLPAFSTLREKDAAAMGTVLNALITKQHPLMFWIRTARMPANIPGASEPAPSPVYTLASKNLAENCIPWVEVPPTCDEIARLLGVSFAPSWTTCLQALNYLAVSGCRQDSMFCDWLIKLSSCSSASTWTTDIKQSFKLIPFLWLPSDTAFVSPQDIFIFDDDRFVLIADLFMEVTGKKMISLTRNSEYWHFSRLLKQMGCTAVPNLSDVLRCISSVAKSPQSFQPKVGDGLSFLTDQGFVNLCEVYRFFETQLEFLCNQQLQSLDDTLDEIFQRSCHSWKLLPDPSPSTARAFDWGWRTNAIAEQLKPIATEVRRLIGGRQLPLIDHMKSMRLESAEYGMCTLLACIYEQTMSAVANKEGCMVTFVHPALCKSCPRLISLLGIQYLENLATLHIEHNSTNQERVYPQVGAMLTRYVGRSFTVLGSVYVAAAVYMHEKLIPLRAENVESFNRKFLESANAPELSWAVINGLIFAALGSSDSTYGSRHAVFSRIMDTLMRHYHPELSDVQIRDAVRRGLSEPSVAAELRGASGRGLETWEHASHSKPTIGSLDEIFCDDRTTRLSSGNVLDLEFYSDAVESSSSSSEATSSNSKGDLGVESAFDVDDEEKYRKNRSGAPQVSSDFQAIQKVFSDRMVSNSAQSVISNDDPDAESTAPRQQRAARSNFAMTDDVKEAQLWTGIVGEIFVYNWLSRYAGPSFRALENWISSNRLRFLPGLGRSNINDAAGFDFVFQDMLALLVQKSDAFAKTAPKVYVEVKAVSGPWDSTSSFYLSQNEIDARDRAVAESNSFYYVIIVENASTPTMTSIARVIPWSSHTDAITVIPNQFEAFINPNAPIISRSGVSSSSSSSSTSGPSSRPHGERSNYPQQQRPSHSQGNNYHHNNSRSYEPSSSTSSNQRIHQDQESLSSTSSTSSSTSFEHSYRSDDRSNSSGGRGGGRGGPPRGRGGSHRGGFYQSRGGHQQNYDDYARQQYRSKESSYQQGNNPAPQPEQPTSYSSQFSNENTRGSRDYGNEDSPDAGNGGSSGRGRARGGRGGRGGRGRGNGRGRGQE